MASESLKGKIVFITGASSGIGAATALAFAGEGARLLLAARRVGRLAEIASMALERGAAAVHSLQLDVRTGIPSSAPSMSCRRNGRRSKCW